jgi:hypothetical protein
MQAPGWATPRQACGRQVRGEHLPKFIRVCRRQVDLIRAAIQPEGDALTGPVELGAIKVINELNTILRAMR